MCFQVELYMNYYVLGPSSSSILVPRARRRYAGGRARRLYAGGRAAASLRGWAGAASLRGQLLGQARRRYSGASPGTLPKKFF